MFASSSSVYGNVGVDGCRWRSPRRRTRSRRTASPSSRRSASASRFHHVYGLQTVALRYFNVFGPRQDPSSQYAAVVPRFITRGRRGAPVTIVRRRHAVEGLHLRRQRRRARTSLAGDADGAVGRVLNVATGGSESVNDVAAAIGRLLGREVASVKRPASGPATCATRAPTSPPRREALGFEPAVDFEEGLRHTIDDRSERSGDGPRVRHRSTSSARATASARCARRSA